MALSPLANGQVFICAATAPAPMTLWRAEVGEITNILATTWNWRGIRVDESYLRDPKYFIPVPPSWSPPTQINLSRFELIMRDNPEILKKEETLDQPIACIGSRSTPTWALGQMISIAKELSEKYWIRTGAAIGADQAFANGAGAKTILYLPWYDYESHWRGLHNYCKIGCYSPTPEAVALASTYHGNWDACSSGARALHGRNAHIIMGLDLNSPVKFVLFWANERAGQVEGGTGLGVRLATGFGIPCINMNKDNWKINLEKLI